MDTDVVTPYGPDGAAGAAVEIEPDATAITIDEVDWLLDEVEAALTRLDEGTYGVCRDCDGSIDDVRLSDRPAGQICSTCEAGDSGPEPLSDPIDPIDAVDPIDAIDPADSAVEDPPAEPDASPWSIKEFPGA
jgi:hypothetical protein